MKFVFGFPADSHKNTIILVFSDRFSNIVHLVTLPELITASHCACVVIVIFFRLHGLPREPMFYRDPRFTDKLQRSFFKTIGTRPIISITDNIETYGQKERANRVFEDILRGYIHFFYKQDRRLANDRACHQYLITVLAPTTHKQFFLSSLRHLQLPTFLECDSNLRRGGIEKTDSDLTSLTDREVTTCNAEVHYIDSG